LVSNRSHSRAALVAQGPPASISLIIRFLALTQKEKAMAMRRLVLAPIRWLTLVWGSRASGAQNEPSRCSAPVQQGQAGPSQETTSHRFSSEDRQEAILNTPLSSGLPARFGPYQICSCIGEGGMGTVYLAFDTSLQRRVALKVPNLSRPLGRKIRRRFAREAQAAAALRHPNLCPVYEVGEVDGIPYLTMPYIVGPTLSTVLATEQLSQHQVVVLVRKIALALEVAHQGGVIHRDVKPGNILIDRHGEPIVVDFGIACLATDPEPLTGPDEFVGTRRYASPEQVQGARNAIGPATDIFSLGTICYQMLTGRLPSTAEPPSVQGLDIDPRLEAACMKALAKDPAQRHASMAEFAAALPF
jgi:serine/threonine protein kinase